MQYQSLGALKRILNCIKPEDIYNSNYFNHRNQTFKHARDNIYYLEILRNHIMHCGTIGTIHNAHHEIIFDADKLRRAFMYIDQEIALQINHDIKSIFTSPKYRNITLKMLNSNTVLNQYVKRYVRT